MEKLYTGYAVAGLLAAVLILVSKRIRPLPVTEALLALVAGVLVGPSVFGLLEVPEEHRTTLLLELTRALLAVSLIGVALRFPVSRLREVLRPVALLVLVVMPVAAAITGALAYLLLGLPLAVALLLGACLSPTDPVLASDVATGGPAERTLPRKVRQVLTEESGFNDGLALPLVLLALAPVLNKAVGGELATAAYEVLAGAAVGAVVGYLVGRTVRRAEQDDDVEGPPTLMLTLVMAFGVLGLAKVLETDALLAVFVAGLLYNAAVGEGGRKQQDALDEAFNRYFVVPVFVLVGVVLPFAGWQELGWGAIPFVLGVLLLRRPPVVMLLRRLLGLRPVDSAFIGWFGPIGISALFYALFAEHEGVEDPRLFAAATLAVAASTVAHGISATPLRKAYGRTEPGREHAREVSRGGG